MNRSFLSSSSCECDTQLSGISADFIKKRSSWRRSPIRIADAGTRSRIQQRGAVSHCSSNSVLSYEPAEHVTEVWAERIARSCWFQTEDSAARRWYPYRSAAVIRV